MALPDWQHDRDYVIADDRLFDSTLSSFDAGGRKQWLREHAPRWLRWEEATRKKIESLRIRVSPMARPKELPRAIAKLSTLRYLSMPLSLASALAPGALPESLEVLSFDETTGGVGTIPSSVVLPRVHTVSATTGELRFTRATFPKLRQVTLKLGARSTITAGVLGSYRKLEMVRVSGLRTASELKSLRVKTLRIGPSALTRLDGLESIASVTTLVLAGLSKLRDLAPLASVPGLRSLHVQNCRALEDLRPLLAIPKLESLVMVNCNGIHVAEVADALIALDLRELAITGKRYLYRDGETWLRSTR